MNHTKATTTLGIAAAIAALAAVLMVAAATATATPLVTGHAAFAVKYGSKVKVGDTRTVAIQAADNSQHCAFGSGSGSAHVPAAIAAAQENVTAPVEGGPGSSCDNHPDNHQDQTPNSGSTGGG